MAEGVLEGISNIWAALRGNIPGLVAVLSFNSLPNR